MNFFRAGVLAVVFLAGLPGWATAATTLPAEADAQELRPEERGLPLLRTFGPREYRGHEQVWDITETAEGVMLFANLNQIAEFDGQTWRTIPVTGGSYLRAMETDASGTVWVAGDNELGRLVTNAQGRLEYQSLRALVPATLGNLGAFWRIYARADGVWFQSNAALLRWDGAAFEVWRIDSTRTAMCYPFEDTLLVCADFGWRLARPGGQWERLGDDRLLTPWGPRFMIPDGAGAWWAGTGMKGVNRLQRDGTFARHETPADEWFQMSRPYQHLALSDGRHLFTSIQAGVLITSPTFAPELVLDESTGLNSNTVISAYVDRRQVLWLGTDRGVVRVELFSPLTTFNQHHGIGRGGLESMERVHGRVVVTGTASVLELRPPETKTGRAKFHVIEKNGSERTTFILRLPDGVLAGGLSGVTWISQGQSVKIDSPPGVREVVEWRGQPGRFIGTHLGGLCSWRREGGQWLYEGDWHDVRGELREIVQDEQGRLWTSTPNAGVLRVTPAPGEARAAKVERFADEAGLPVQRGRVWMSHIGGAPLFRVNTGMFRFDERSGRFTPETGYGPRFADGSTRARLLAADDAGGLWIAVEALDGRPKEIVHARDGRVEIVPMSGLADVGGLNFVTWEKFEGREILWIGGEAELWQLDLTRWRRQPATPLGRTLLREITSGTVARVFTDGRTPEFQAEENTLRFTFATLGLAGEKQPRHETRLRGFRDGGTVLSTANERTFTNLPAGEYVFEACGVTEDGRRSAPVEFAFIVHAPWWQTVWAWSAYGVAAGLSLFAYIRWRIRRLTRERNRLEKIVADRTAELARQNLELERLHRLDQDEKLAARLAEEKAVLELLRYQLNPHFLFNSLNSIRALVYSSPDAAGEMVTRLSDFCRHTLTRSGDELTTVAQELEMTRTYLEIERARWQENLVTQVEVEPEAEHQVMPRFLFLPLIENAIKYGGRTSPGVLQVRVSVRLDGGFLRCEVANTGVWNAADDSHPKESTHIGLENMRRRLARHFGRAAALEIQPGDGWVRVGLRLPVITEYVPAAAAKAAARGEAEDA